MIKAELKDYINQIEKLIEDDPYIPEDEIYDSINYEHKIDKQDLISILNGQDFEIENDILIRPFVEDLESYVIPDGVTSIGDGIEYGAFEDYENLKTISIPNSVRSIGEYTFAGCSSLTSISIPDNVTSIGRSAFKGCSSLESINYNGTTKQWNDIVKEYAWDDETVDYTVYCSNRSLSKFELELEGKL